MDTHSSPRRAAPRHAKRKIWVYVVVAVIVVLGGGGAAYWFGLFDHPTGDGPIVTDVPTPLPTETLTPMPKERWALTGVIGDHGLVTERPALVVKIENAPESRPQEGLEDADIVFEEMVEGGVSRFAAIFHSTLPEQIAPIRSVRPMDGPITAWTGGLLAFSGGQAQFTSRAENDGLQLISMDWGADGFSREPSRDAPHDVAGDTASFLAQADEDHQSSPPQFCAFDTTSTGGTAQTSGTATTTVSVSISSAAQPTWTWDTASNMWLRAEGSTPAMAASGAQLSTANVLVVDVNVVMLEGTDAAGTHIPETIVVGQGTGLVASGGMSAPITWQKDSETAPWQFFDASGAPLVLNPGSTWVELVPSSGSWSVS